MVFWFRIFKLNRDKTRLCQSFITTHSNEKFENCHANFQVFLVYITIVINNLLYIKNLTIILIEILFELRWAINY
jgi:hypothetical protein